MLRSMGAGSCLCRSLIAGISGVAYQKGLNANYCASL